MNTPPVIKFDGKSLIFGALFASAFIVVLGADKSDISKVDALHQRFLVLESNPVRDAANGYQSHLLKVCPFYGKIDQESLKFRLVSETQEINMIVVVSEGHKIARGDIVGFESLQHQRLTPGSNVVRHLPSGGQELVP
ncbi:hypothetical protein VN12_04040 [Pirellula sp. SH-Sr6A]|uniref:hypothetical protein n=1 Tax=Pirellula sp. SH-Sr6A TaxID=1632865 RepID=UPI00078B1C9D|nr:hypothetical protein [Pirellula sp. SH-Sr6A]AMV31265.1 hypothetical protein VN12_04040 [Pirellula sp. SH-Sr6A]